MAARRGARAFVFNYVVWKDAEAAAELYIDTGESDDNKQIFESLSEKKVKIEKAFGGALRWEPLEERRACRIRYLQSLGGLTAGESEWPHIWDPLIDAMRILVEALKPYVRSAGV